MNKAVANRGGLSERQYAFGAGRSTIGAINEVLTSVKAVQRFKRKRTTQQGQEKWKTEASGRWTAKLLPDITR